MRLLFINQYFPPDATNSAHLLGELSEDLAEFHEVTVVAGQPSYNPAAGAKEPEGVRVFRPWSSSFNRSTMAGRLLNYATFLVSSVLSALRVPRVDLVVTMTDPPIIGAVGWLASVRHRCPFVMVYQDVFPDIAVALGKMQSRKAAAVWRWVNRQLRKRATRIVVVGRDMKEKLRTDGVDDSKLVYLPNWASPQDSSKTQLDEVRNSQGWNGHFVVMHAGNVGLAQNLPFVIDAAEMVRDDKDVLFVFLGDGAAKDSLLREARRRKLDSIVFLPYQPKPEAQELMAAADVHLISLAPGMFGCAAPSKTYGILASGRPAIGALEAGSEIALTLEEYQCGVRVDPDDPVGLSDAIRRLKAADLDEMGGRGRKALEARFQRTLVTSQYRKLFEEVTRS
ncbi:MAG: glycosyltransferase [Actinobacteria bacterium]|nr:glycosyltransferase [Actinomycetota bacterium]